MMRFEVELIPTRSGRWTAQLAGGAIIVADCRHPRTQVARALLAQGANPLSLMVVRSGAKLIALDTLARATGTSLTCTDEGAMERTDLNALVG